MVASMAERSPLSAEDSPSNQLLGTGWDKAGQSFLTLVHQGIGWFRISPGGTTPGALEVRCLILSATGAIQVLRRFG